MNKQTTNNKEAVLLFSGGTDSTLTAALLQEKFDVIHLITYDRFGIFEVENAKTNAKLLKEKYGKNKFIHKIINFDKIFKEVSYNNYIANVIKHGFMNLSTCGLCKLSMHVLTVAYCLKSGIQHVSDGANKGMEIFPAQMDVVLEELRSLYAKFNIEYTNPVFNFEAPADKSLVKDENIALLQASIQKDKPSSSSNKSRTTGDMLHDLGLSPEKNIKGTRYDQRRQPRCFQFMLFSVYVNKWQLPKNGMESYKAETLEFFKQKISDSSKLLEKFVENENEELFEIKEL